MELKSGFGQSSPLIEGVSLHPFSVAKIANFNRNFLKKSFFPRDVEGAKPLKSCFRYRWSWLGTRMPGLRRASDLRNDFVSEGSVGVELSPASLRLRL